MDPASQIRGFCFSWQAGENMLITVLTQEQRHHVLQASKVKLRSSVLNGVVAALQPTVVYFLRCPQHTEVLTVKC